MEHKLAPPWLHAISIILSLILQPQFPNKKKKKKKELQPTRPDNIRKLHDAHKIHV